MRRVAGEGPCAVGKREVSTVGYITSRLVVGGKCGDPKKKRIGEGDEIDVIIEKVTFGAGQVA